MKENLQALLASLQVEKLHLEIEKENLVRQSVALNRSRTTTARNCLVRILPDLEMSTIKTLLLQVPDFHVPIVSGWFGFGKKVAPDITLDSLRMKLGAHLDNTRGVVPTIWKNEVHSIDASIRDLQENLIRSNAERIADIGVRIKALEKLLRIDVKKMDPKVRKRLEQAVASQVRTSRQSSRPYRNFRSAMPVNTSYPSHTQIDSDSGPSLLDMWLWWQILSPNSECSREVHQIESGGGGDFGGGGASASYEDRSGSSPLTSDVQQFTDEASQTSTKGGDYFDRNEESQLAFQANLGSQSFS